jgi:hypothetical protein
MKKIIRLIKLDESANQIKQINETFYFTLYIVSINKQYNQTITLT